MTPWSIFLVWCQHVVLSVDACWCVYCSEPSNVMMTGTGRGTATPTEGGDGARSQGEGDKENAGADENQRTRRHSRSGSVTSSKPHHT